jgi:Nucleotidyl transferase AbiEii toxin, Type IV TA system
MACLDRLTHFQREVLRAFFSRESGFFLTGGAALAGFYLKHRPTNDLDLFTTMSDVFDRGPHILQDVASALNATGETVRHAPGFHRSVLSRAGDAVVVDLVWDRVPQTHAEKPEQDGIRVDPLDEILANKLTTILSRGEERDLVDLFFLEKAGCRVESGLSAALAKDGACTPATLAWLLSEVDIPDGITLPADCPPADLRAFVQDLIVRLRKLALPAPPVLP